MFQNRESAKEYYEKAHDIEGLMNSLYFLEDFDELEGCISKLSDNNPLLGKLGQMLASVGMCDQAVAAYLRQGDVKSAVNTCVNLKQWGQAVELAQKYKMPQISALLGKHAAQLLQEGRLFEAIELKRKAGKYVRRLKNDQKSFHIFTKIFLFEFKMKVFRCCTSLNKTS